MCRHPIRRMLPLILFALLVLGSLSASAKEEKRTCPMDREYFLYAPDTVDPARTYWLVVGVHGAGGKGDGAGGLADWAKRGDCIVVGPSFPNGYQGLGLDTDKQLIGIFKQLRESYKLHDKLFVAGFSGGAQFAHRFTLAHPDLVVGCAAHSAGTWATGDDHGPVGLNKEAAGVPFVISCGQADTTKSVPQAPFTRIEWAHRFEAALKDAGYTYKAAYWPGVGHQVTKDAMAMTEECYRLSTTGLYPAQRKEVDALFVPVEDLVKAGKYDAAARKLETVAPAYVELRKKQKAAPKPAAEDAGWHETPAMQSDLSARAVAYAKGRAAELEATIDAAKKGGKR